ncbi:DNA sulfur modification protein DndD [Coleofasciculus chthonoplastes PCC 7420]|uniref:Nuclease SbcCD subunit C n=1 Tax=Coleofasciculus chthonoplastes PCC 7420 TaxID=118168 RepID=B4VR83_9CYAN|nr:DNA sulfur modification protein DndD [Coleofasciculus chthonoplastes]EDX75390.1 DNA sulfur modification protein DndD [Coleofasciculus chthonoplastes PCC 7420]
MIFLELALQNFGPYQGRQVINLRPETNNSSHPIILFGGMNGGGKTTLMDAIRLSLYGSRAQCSTRGNLSYNDFLTQCVNRNTPPTEKTRIELAFEVVEEDKPRTLRIVRYWTKELKDGKDTLGILVDEEWPDKALANTWDDYIENLLPLGISNLFLFDGEQVKELAELETPPPLVVSAIQSLLGLELAERLSTDLDILASRKRRDIANQKELKTLDNIEAKLIDQKERLDAAEQDKSALKSKLDYATKKQHLASDKFISEGGKLASERSQLEAQSETLIEQANQVRQEMRDLAAGVLPLSLISPLLEQAKAQAEQEQKQHQIKLTREVLKERDARLIQYIKKISLTPKRVNQIQSFLESDNQELDQEIAAQEEPWLLADEAAITRLETLLNYELSTAQTNAQSQRERLQTLETEIDALDRQIATAASPEAYNTLKQAFTDAQNQVVKVKAAYENASRRCEEIKNKITKTKKELETYADETIKLKNNQHIINSIAKVQATLELFREKLTLKKLNKLEIEVTECFRYLLHKSDLVHRVAIDTHSFSLSLYDPEGQPIPKHRLSAGEKQLLAISFLWGLARVSGRHLPVAIDTPLGRLDSSHRSNLVERYFPTASHQVILLSTDTEIRETEVKRLRELDAIAQEYCLNYDPQERQTIVEPGYFW